MKTTVTYYNTDFYNVTVDNDTTLERLDTTFRARVSLKEAVQYAKKLMRWIECDPCDKIVAYVTDPNTGEVLAEIKKKS